MICFLFVRFVVRYVSEIFNWRFLMIGKIPFIRNAGARLSILKHFVDHTIFKISAVIVIG